ncbi:PilZ domain-containing protein [Echinimonas agarilytica]|uniref:PilZ domain-containing protein n=1 Tax=Echinimonas agarilytica TaxID=1215918 RepID=A0AA42B8G7_9GAMM|nr:PilZ domain-containing protein [Echinimonas agarilytica]MCM2680528.1 PilZ domain-containing protein [Echinimonas agarilytica]
MDIETYRPLIEQLKPLVKDPEFGELLARFVRTEPNQAQFFIKMELKRLAEPCIRVIDCRPRAGENAKSVTVAGITHYLDSHTQVAFEREMKVFGRYTMGVYETVIAVEKSLRAANKAAPTKANNVNAEDLNPDVAASMYNVPLLKLGSHVQRRAERLILSAKVNAVLPGDRRIDAYISDFSIQGIKLRLPAHIHLIEKAIVHIDLSFMRFGDDLTPDNWQGRYRLIGVHKQNALHKWVRLQRVDNDKMLTERIERYFEANRARLTIDTDSAVESVQSRGFEDAYFRQVTGIPILIGLTEQGLKPIRTLRSQANQELFDYWRGLNGRLHIGSMLTTARIRELSAAMKKGQTTLLYSFSHLANGQLNYYVASHQELEEKGLKELFFQTGSQRDSWRVMSATIHALSQQDATRPLALPEEMKQKINTQQLDRESRAKLAPLKGVVMLFDITSRMGANCYRTLYRSELNDANQLAQFQLKMTGNPIQEESFEFRHQRSEPRYMYRTDVTARMTERAASGSTINLSGKGLQIQLKKSLPVAEGDLIMISVPKLQNLDKSAKLTDVPYRVVAMNQSQTLISLRVNNDTVHPTVVPFMKNLLKLNADKLKKTTEQASLPDYVSALRNMLVPILPHPALFVSRIENKVQVSHVATSNDDNGIVSFLEQLHQQTKNPQGRFVNLTIIERGPQFNQMILRPLRVLQEGGIGCFAECLIAAQRGANNKITEVECMYLQDTSDPIEAQAFIEAAKKKSDFFAVRINVSRYGNPNFTSINKELHYISDYASHKAQQLEKQLFSIMGIGEIVDITEEMMVRLCINNTAAPEPV